MKKILMILVSVFMLFSMFGCKTQEENPYEEYGIRPIGSYSELGKFFKTRQVSDFWRFGLKDFYAVENAEVDAPADEATEESSQTNTQVEGVDEEDTVKNDGRFIYIIREGFLVILDTETNDFVKYQSEDFQAETMYLLENRLVVLGRKYVERYIEEKPYDDGYAEDRDEANDPDVDKEESSSESEEAETEPSKPAPDIDYSGYYWSYSDEYIVKIYDISSKDINEIDVVRTLRFKDSNYNSSRVIDDNFYLILNNSSIYDYDNKEVKPFVYFDSLQGEEAIELPSDHVFFIGNDDNVYYSYTVLVGVDVVKEEEMDVNAYVGYFSNIYSSLNGLYVGNIYNMVFRTFIFAEDYSYDPQTFIYRFEYDGAKIIYKNFSEIKGSIKDQFSMDEYDGVLRVATTVNEWDSEKSESLITAFDVTGNRFDLISTLGGIGLNERIYSVRFEKERAYVVTFRTIDPFYVIDVEDPKAMKILGELKLPGVSDYLHPINDTLKLGIGRMTEVTDYGSTITVGLKITLFDVTNEEKPVDVSTFELKGASSDIAYNHKTLIPVKSRQLYALPIYNWYDYQSTQGMYVMWIDVENKEIVVLGSIAHQNLDEAGQDEWRYYYNRIVDKGVIIGDKIYSISNEFITINELTEKLPLIETIRIS
ncbi:MAG: beta-propeller domain-containing protein [Bacilli bacterium]|nr:beta-propeller domain-containing protein [Bacilli bacterium]